MEVLNSMKGCDCMAIPTSIKTLLSGDVVEWARIELKQTWDPAASLKTICAFANDLDNWGGGYIIIGVQEVNGRPIYPLKGVPPEKLDSFQKNIFAKCKLLRPSYTPIISVEKYQGKYFIVIWCPGGDNRPYSSPKTMGKNNKERIHYIRKASSTIAPSDDEEKDLFNLANRVPFDDRVNHQAEITDLNITLIQNYLREIGSSLYEKSITGDFTELCSDMNIISILPEYVKPKNVGLMFFCAQPDKFFPFTQIDVVQFPDGLGGDNIIENTFKGPIHHQLREALQFIKNSIVTKKIVKSADKAESDWVFNYPYAALEEALANAVYHRAYDIREPIEVRVEKNMIEIVSFPGPDRSVTQEGLKQYKVSNRRYRNRRIGDILKELHLTEGRNTGFGKILSALEENGSPKPEFETDDGHNYFITRLFVHEAFIEKEANGAKVTQKGAEVGQKGAKVTQKGAKVLEKGAEVGEKGARVTQKGAEVDEKRAEVLEKGAEVTQKGAEVDEKGAEVLEKGAEVEQKGAEVGQKGAEVGQKGAEVEQKGAEVTQKGAEVGQKGAKVTHKGAKVLEKGAEVEQKGAKFTQKGAEVMPKGAEVEQKGAKVTQKGAKVTRKGAEVMPKGAKVTQKGAEVGEKGAEVGPKGAKKGIERSLEILNRMRENPFVTQVKLMEEFNLSRKQIQNIIQYLRQNGMVDREGSNRSGKWIVKK